MDFSGVTIKIIRNFLIDTGMSIETADSNARCLIARLAQNDPPLLIVSVTEVDFKEDK
jgi:hypothetical protein